MCHVSHLTDALLGMVALSLAVCVTARSSTGVVCFYSDAKSCFLSFLMSLSKSIVVKNIPKRFRGYYDILLCIIYISILRSYPAGQKREKKQLLFWGQNLQENISWNAVSDWLVPQIWEDLSMSIFLYYSCNLTSLFWNGFISNPLPSLFLSAHSSPFSCVPAAAPLLVTGGFSSVAFLKRLVILQVISRNLGIAFTLKCSIGGSIFW